MTNSFTNKAQEYMLMGTATPNGGIANLGTKLKLYDAASTPAKDGTGFTEVANGNGYSTGGKSLARVNYTMSLATGNEKIVIDDQTWTASGGTIPTVAGAYLTDASDNPLAWWERGSTVTLNDGDTITTTSLTLTIT